MDKDFAVPHSARADRTEYLFDNSIHLGRFNEIKTTQLFRIVRTQCGKCPGNRPQISRHIGGFSFAISKHKMISRGVTK